MFWNYHFIYYVSFIVLHGIYILTNPAGVAAGLDKKDNNKKQMSERPVVLIIIFGALSLQQFAKPRQISGPGV